MRKWTYKLLYPYSNSHTHLYHNSLSCKLISLCTMFIRNCQHKTFKWCSKLTTLYSTQIIKSLWLNDEGLTGNILMCNTLLSLNLIKLINIILLLLEEERVIIQITRRNMIWWVVYPCSCQMRNSVACYGSPHQGVLVTFLLPDTLELQRRPFLAQLPRQLRVSAVVSVGSVIRQRHTEK